MTISDCETKCKQLPGCTGITVQLAGGGAARGLYQCYRKNNIDIEKCDHNTGFDTYTFNSGRNANATHTQL